MTDVMKMVKVKKVPEEPAVMEVPDDWDLAYDLEGNKVVGNKVVGNYFYDLPVDLQWKIELYNRAKELCDVCGQHTDVEKLRVPCEEEFIWQEFNPVFPWDVPWAHYGDPSHEVQLHPNLRSAKSYWGRHMRDDRLFRLLARDTLNLLCPELPEAMQLPYEPLSDQDWCFERPPGRSDLWGLQIDALDLNWGRVGDDLKFRSGWMQRWIAPKVRKDPTSDDTTIMLLDTWDKLHRFDCGVYEALHFENDEYRSDPYVDESGNCFYMYEPLPHLWVKQELYS